MANKRRLVRFVPTPGWGSPGWMSWEDADALLLQDENLRDMLAACQGLSQRQIESPPRIEE